jgi:hypothetical protein
LTQLLTKTWNLRRVLALSTYFIKKVIFHNNNQQRDWHGLWTKRLTSIIKLENWTQRRCGHYWLLIISVNVYIKHTTHYENARRSIGKRSRKQCHIGAAKASPATMQFSYTGFSSCCFGNAGKLLEYAKSISSYWNRKSLC